MSDTRERIETWPLIARAAGWSVTQLKRMERVGLPIRRKKTGGRNRVWVYRDELEHFLSLPLPSFSKQEPVSNRWKSYRHEIMALCLCILPAIGIVINWRPGPTKELISGGPRNFVSLDYAIDKHGYMNQLGLVRADGTKQEIWSYSSVANPGFKATTILGERLVHLEPATQTYPAVFVQVVTESAPHIAGPPDLVVPPLPLEPVTLENGDLIQDVDSVQRLVRLEHPLFDGWGLLVNSRSYHLGSLCLLDRRFRILARIDHPGHFQRLLMVGDQLILEAYLNARRYEDQPLRRALLSINLYQCLLSARSQVRPFNIDTIDERYFVYSIESVPTLVPDAYMAARPSTFAETRLDLKTGRKGTSVVWQVHKLQDRRYSMTVLLNERLRVIQASSIDPGMVPDMLPAEISALSGIQRWEGDRWGAWEISDE